MHGMDSKSKNEEKWNRYTAELIANKQDAMNKRQKKESSSIIPFLTNGKDVQRSLINEGKAASGYIHHTRTENGYQSIKRKRYKDDWSFLDRENNDPDDRNWNAFEDDHNYRMENDDEVLILDDIPQLRGRMEDENETSTRKDNNHSKTKDDESIPQYPTFDLSSYLTKPSQSTHSKSSSTSQTTSTTNYLHLLQSSTLHSSVETDLHYVDVKVYHDVKVDSMIAELLQINLQLALMQQDYDVPIPHNGSSSNQTTTNPTTTDKMNTNNAANTTAKAPVKDLPKVPVRFRDEQHYLQTFQPLLIEEVTSAIGALLWEQSGGRGNRRTNTPCHRLQAVHLKCVRRSVKGVVEDGDDPNRLDEIQVTPVEDTILPSSQSTVGRDEEETEEDADRGGGRDKSRSQLLRRSKVDSLELMKDDLVLIITHKLVKGNPPSTYSTSYHGCLLCLYYYCYIMSWVELGWDHLFIDHHLGLHQLTLEQVLGVPHCLGLVMTNAHLRRSYSSRKEDRDNSSSNSHSSISNNTSSSSSEESYQTISLLSLSSHPADLPPSKDTNHRLTLNRRFLAIPLMNLSTFTREWMALQGIYLHEVMPLAPYILKASPAVSPARLRKLHEAIRSKVEEIRKSAVYAKNRTGSNGSSHGSSSSTTQKTRHGHLMQALMDDLVKIQSFSIDSSLLKNSNVIQTLKGIIANEMRVISEDCIRLCREVISSWKKQFKEEYQSSSHHSSGGKVLVIPSDEEVLRHRPENISCELWTSLTQSFNTSQLFAIKYVNKQLNQTHQDTRITLIQGPPGTGKTSTIVGMVSVLLQPPPSLSGLTSSQQELVTAYPQLSHEMHSIETKKPRILLCTQSNGAIDEIITRLLSHGVMNPTGGTRSVKIVRLGEPLDNASGLIPALTLDAQVEMSLQTHEITLKLNAVRMKIKEIETEIHRLDPYLMTPPEVESSKGVAVGTSKKDLRLKKLRKELHDCLATRQWMESQFDRLRSDIRYQLLWNSDIIASTLSACGKSQFIDSISKDGRLTMLFDTVIIDEAAQATEPATLIPLRFGCRKLVLVGDPRQLPATVLSRSADRCGLSQSLFERLETACHDVVMLTVQYRMHPAIRQFPSDRFYQGRLIDSQQIIEELTSPPEASTEATSVQRVRSRLLTQLGIDPIVFYDVRGEERPSGKSFQNEKEVLMIVSILKRLYASIHPLEDLLKVAIIAPYKAQINRLKDALRTYYRGLNAEGVHWSHFEDNIEVNRYELHPSCHLINCFHEIGLSSIDGFQGREKDVVLFSCVRTSLRGNIGFLSDERRMNVAITRAKKSLIIVGNRQALMGNSLWKSFIISLEHRHYLRTYQARLASRDDDCTYYEKK